MRRACFASTKRFCPTSSPRSPRYKAIQGALKACRITVASELSPIDLWEPLGPALPTEQRKARRSSRRICSSPRRELRSADARALRVCCREHLLLGVDAPAVSCELLWVRSIAEAAVYLTPLRNSVMSLAAMTLPTERNA